MVTIPKFPYKKRTSHKQFVTKQEKKLGIKYIGHWERERPHIQQTHGSSYILLTQQIETSD